MVRDLCFGLSLILHNPENWGERGGRVSRLGLCDAGRTEVGIEFTEPAPDFWLIPAESKSIRIDQRSRGTPRSLSSVRMDLPVTMPAERYEVFFSIVAQLASRRNVVNFQAGT